jgi:hypothetical protein
MPCSAIYSRIKKIFEGDIVGWRVSGDGKNINDPLLYLTDSLLREILIS